MPHTRRNTPNRGDSEAARLQLEAIAIAKWRRATARLPVTSSHAQPLFIGRSQESIGIDGGVGLLMMDVMMRRREARDHEAECGGVKWLVSKFPLIF